MKIKLLLTFCVFWAYLSLSAQLAYPSLSPKGFVSQKIGFTTITVEYERPSVRGRVIFGELVPWNKVWRTGAAYCTKVSFDKAIRLNGQRIPPGKYSLFTIPNKDEWVVILNADTALYGSYDYDNKKDIVRLTVGSNKTDRLYEALTIDIDFIPYNARIYISWENTQVSFDIQTSTDEEVLRFINENLLTDKSKNEDDYASGASYLLLEHNNLEDALVLCNKSIALVPNGWAFRLKMETLEKLKKYNQAIKTAKQNIELIKTREYNDGEKYRKEDIDRMEKAIARLEGL